MSERVHILDMTREELREQMAAWGEPTYRADQVRHWLLRELETDPARMTNLSASLRARLAAEATLNPLVLATETVSRDRMARKALFTLSDGQAIETVLMLYDRRRTLCISTQAGCGMGCPFCATGLSGFTRNLTPGEIVAQVLHYARWLHDPEAGGRDAAPVRRPTNVTNIVVMGMGEPFANYNATWQALRMLTDPQGFGLGARHVTLSTVGIVPGIERMAEEPLQIGLAVSLHAPTDELRNRLGPINRRYPIAQLLVACRHYVERTRRRISFEYALMGGINDDLIQARQLADLLDGLLCHVNLIPLNPVEGSPFQPSPPERTRDFVAELKRRGIPATLRLRRGIEIDAGCGQLRRRVRQELPLRAIRAGT
ncbi:MAG: 23S rRNA (adenine(2503)-C(2))-methyltransferase RlmN [Anaerolineae bacterium]|nr:23S rRNA (adenine(2503)-C(2))-methyltransferase RlmN [Anaerolineae bacterium]